METRIAQLSLSVEEDDAFVLEGSLRSQTVCSELYNMHGREVSIFTSNSCSFFQRMSCCYVEARKRYFCSGTG